MKLTTMLCTLGRFDIPIIQMQPPFVVDLLDSNILLFGAAMSGKTTFLKNLIHILHKRYDESREQIFILDFGGALAEYGEFPLVSAYFDNSNEEYVKRVFRVMDHILRDNIRELNGKNYRDAESQPLHTTFIIDNLNAFMDENGYAAYREKLAKLCRDGLSRGITVVVTAAETKGLGSCMGSFRQKIVFEMPQDKYAEIFSGKVGIIGNNPGHGFANVTVKPQGVTGTFRMNLPYEMQCLSGNGAGSEEDFVRKLRQKFGYNEGIWSRSVKKYQTFPEELTAEAYEKLKQHPREMPGESRLPVSVGLDYVDFCPVTVDLEQSHVIAIYGKKEFGKTNLLKLLLAGLAQQKKGLRMVFLDDGRNQLRDICDDFSDRVDCVYFNGFAEGSLKLEEHVSKVNTRDIRPEEILRRKLSPLQRFYLYLDEKYLDMTRKMIGGMFGVTGETDLKRLGNGKEYLEQPFTVFVVQSKSVYLNTNESKPLIGKVLPQLAAVAEEKGYLFIFSDVQKISEIETNTIFNNALSAVFLLDNIAEFAGERGQRTVFGNMDVKALKEDYARCERGDGYYYDVEADNLVKAKFIKYE